MPEFSFRVVAVVQHLEEALLAEALFHPEFSVLDDAPDYLEFNLDACLQQLLKQDSALNLHRRHLAGEPRVSSVNLILDPPIRSAAWRESLELNLPTVLWEHGDEAFLAYVPALGIEILASTPQEREIRLGKEIREALMREKKLTLAHLAWLPRCREVTLLPMTVKAERLSPKRQAAEAREKKTEELTTLKEVATDLTTLDLPEAFEVEEYVTRLAEALTGRTPRSVLLVGPSGVGKTAVLQELVRRRDRLALGRTPFWSTSGSRLVAGQCGFGMWQQRCLNLLKEVGKIKAVLHLGNLIELMEVGKSEHHAQGIASFLRPYLGRGDFLAVAECTPEQLPLLEKQEAHLLRLFAQIRIAEPDRTRGLAVLSSVAVAHALARAPEQTGSPIQQAALETLDALHRRYATYSAYPGRPLRFLRNLLADTPASREITPGDVTAAFSRETGLPSFLLDDAVKLDLEAARQWFSERVVGQSEAVDLIVELLATVKARLTRPRKPIASLLFIGPTGVGKTEMAKALAEYLFGSRSRLTRFDMSEYSDPLAVQRLIGGSFSKEGLLTARVREQPFSVLLLDEFEKAHPQLFDLLLQVLGEGRLTDACGRLADFCNSVVIMTSNLGAASYQQGGFGFAGRDASGTKEPEAMARRRREQAREHFVREVQAYVRPEFFNRIDRVVPFAPLEEAVILKIANLQLDQIRQRDGIRYRGVALDTTAEVSAWLARAGYDLRYGARPLKRAMERELLAPLAEQMNGYTAETPLKVSVKVRDGRLSLHVRARTDEQGRQTGTHGQALELAARVATCVALRRDVQRLVRCPSSIELFNEIFRLERIAERLQQKRRVWEDTRNLNRLPYFRQLRDGILELQTQSFELEDHTLAAFHDQKPVDGEALTAAVTKGETRLIELLQELYLLRYENAGTVVVCVYSERMDWLLALTQAYWELARAQGKAEVWQFLPGKKGPGSPIERRLVLDPENLFAGKQFFRVLPWDCVTLQSADEEVRADIRDTFVGLGLAIDMPAALPTFGPEAGLHVFVDVRTPGVCLVETTQTPLIASVKDGFHIPPAGVDRKGFIGTQERRRTYYPERREAEDSLLGKLDMPGGELRPILAAATHQNMMRGVRSLLAD